MQTGQRFMLGSCAFAFIALGTLCFTLRRLFTVCIVSAIPTPTAFSSLADRTPAGMLSLMVVGVSCFFLGAVTFILATVRQAHFACPHCARSIEPRWSLTGNLSGRAGD